MLSEEGGCGVLFGAFCLFCGLGLVFLVFLNNLEISLHLDTFLYFLCLHEDRYNMQPKIKHTSAFSLPLNPTAEGQERNQKTKSKKIQWSSSLIDEEIKSKKK